MNKRLIALLIALLLTFACFAAQAEEAPNLLTNGGFEQVDGSGNPNGWYTNAYRTQEGYTRFEVTSEKAHSGTYSAKITNANLNDSRYLCTVAVEPESMYKVSGYVLVEEMQDSGNGANLAVEGVYSFSQCLYDTNGDWKYIEWYGETDTNQTEVQLGVRIGGYGAESQGTAYFDDLSVQKVQTLPDGEIASLWFSIDTGSAADDVTDTDDGTPQKSTAWFVLLAAAFVLLALLCRRFLQTDGLPSANESRQNALVVLAFGAALVLAFIVRIVLACRIAGYQVDMNCFAAWSLRVVQNGPAGFYAPDTFCDYPPGYMLLLWPVGRLLQAIGYSDSPTVRLLLKTIPILCDMLIAIVLFAHACKPMANRGLARRSARAAKHEHSPKRLPHKAAAFVALLFAFNPSALVNGAAWGQVDSVLALLMLLTAICAMRREWKLALPLYVLSVLMKPQALLFGPIGLLWLVMELVLCTKSERKAQWKAIGLGAAFAVAVALVIVLPFSVRQEDPLWLFKLYQSTLSSYDYATLNTANLYYLLGGNWSKLNAGDGNYVATLSRALPLITSALLAFAAFMGERLYRGLAQAKADFAAAKTRLHERKPVGDEGRRLSLAVLCALFALVFLVEAFFPCTFLSYGTTWMVFVYLFAFLGLLADGSAARLPFYMALVLVGVYVLGLKVHERYLFAALALLPLAYLHTRDRRLLWLTVGFSVTTFLNTAIVLDNSLLFGSSMGHLNADTVGLNDALCVVNLLLCGFAGYTAFTGVRESAPTAQNAARERTAFTGDCYRNDLLHPKDARLHLGLRDWLIMGVTMVVYAAVAFTNLGSMKAPQTAWVSTSDTEQVVFELPERQDFKLLYYAGVSYNNFSVSVSADGVTWTDPQPCEMREGLCYRWMYLVGSTGVDVQNASFNDNNPNNVLWLNGKYLRVNAESAGLNLWEILLRDHAGNTIPLTLVSHTGAKDVLSTERPPENLIDEQDTMDGEPGWFYGTYFDEIYHARTAYEHLHGQSPYETTHPPLGKLIMAVGIAIFGMTPFGWRFSGTLIGVLMLPALYLLAKQLTHKRSLATFSMLLFAFDLMHFTQTRIATIDSFPVFFIILSYLCMARYLMSDVHAIPTAAVGEDKPRVLTKPFLKTLIPLALSGLFMGLSIASKWIGLYSAVGLAILFFAGCYRQFRTGLLAYDTDPNDSMTELQKRRVFWARALSLKRILVTCAFCVLFFIAVPALIYYLSYIPYLSPSGPVTIARIIRAQESMLAYHSTPGLGMDHPFQSPWWQWPFILKPMWFAQDKFEPTGYASTIMCLGNPLIFYVGALCMVAVLAMFVCKYVSFKGGVRLKQGDGNLTLGVLVIGFLAQYLPWVLVPRSMYMYHYFASVPFIILATTVVANLIPNEKLRKRVMIAYVALSAVFFVAFFPYASGVLTPTSWLDALKWFSRLYY